MSRKKHKHEEHVDESWLVPYSDLLTLLLALFIVMFAMSSADQAKFEQFGYAWKETVESGFVGVDSDAEEAGEETSQNNASEETEGIVISSEEIEKLKALQAEIDQYIKEQGYEDEMSTKYTDDGLLIVIKDNILFESGSAELGVEHNAVMAPLADILKKTSDTTEIIVSGHTDNVPIHNAEYDSNWRLSMDRAVNFMTELIDMGGMPVDTFSARGYGEMKPLVANDTPEHRAQNRRVEVLVRPKVNMNEEVAAQKEAENAAAVGSSDEESSEKETKTEEKEESGH